jgi:hypothetical protein
VIYRQRFGRGSKRREFLRSSERGGARSVVGVSRCSRPADSGRVGLSSG